MKSILKRTNDKDKPKLELDFDTSKNSDMISPPYLLSQTTKYSTQRNKLDDHQKGRFLLSPKMRPIKSRKQSLVGTKLHSRIKDENSPCSTNVVKHTFEFQEDKLKAPQNFNLLEKTEETMSRIRRMSRNKDTAAKLVRNEVDRSAQRLVGSRVNKNWANILKYKQLNMQNKSLDNIKSNNAALSPHKKQSQPNTRKLSLEDKLNQYYESPTSILRKSSVFNWSDIKEPISIKIYDENSRIETQVAKNTEKRPLTNSTNKRRMVNNGVNSGLSEVSYVDSTEYLGTAGHSLLLKIIADEKRSIPTTAREKKSLGKIILRNKQIINRLSEDDKWKDEQLTFVSAKVNNIQNHASKLIETYFPSNRDSGS